MFVVPDMASCYRRMMAARCQSNCALLQDRKVSYLTCSDTRLVVPASSTHLPMNISPRKGFRGFMRFFFPFSSRLLCCCFNVLKNHFRTSNARFSGSGSLAGATNSEGCSAQYAENSIIDCEDRRIGGAVRDARSPLNVARDCPGLAVCTSLLWLYR